MMELQLTAIDELNLVEIDRPQVMSDQILASTLGLARVVLGSVNAQDAWTRLQMLTDRDLGLVDLVTHRFTLDEYRRAFELAERGRTQAMKIAIIF